jgi:integrase
VWKPTARRAGIDPTPHEFRHSWVTHLRAAGVDPADLADVAGHSMQTATAHYTHALKQSYEQIRRVIG